MTAREGSEHGLGLRTQIVLALAGVMLLAFIPLFFAIAQITRSTSLTYRDDSARSLGRAIAAHVAQVRASEPSALARTMSAHLGDRGARAICLFDTRAEVVECQGEAGDVTRMRAPARPYGEALSRADVPLGRALDIVLPTSAGEAVLVRVSSDEDPIRTAQIVQGIAVYMVLFALALLVFSFIVLTRMIVRPIEKLGRGADRVAGGARDLTLPSTSAREVSELGASVRAMTARLLDDERALRAKVDELTAAKKTLGETREQLAGSEHMASIGRLAAGIAHEIGNPIAAIMGMHELLDDPETSPETRNDFLRRMRRETERIHVVVRDLLDYARPEIGPASVRSPQTSLELVASDAVALVLPQRDFKTVRVDLDVPSDLIVSISPQRLTQVFLNLLLNAGGAFSSAPRKDARIVLRARKDGRTVRIEVEDNGPGVPPELAPRIFEPFVTSREVGRGTGLGLSVCRGIIESAGGRIYLEDAYAAGARFVIELPST
jgi:two-component system NtrC family sensor kinase